MVRGYTDNFKNNEQVALKAENIVQELLGQIYTDQKFYSEHYNDAAYHLGDIISSTGIYYEVKDDQKIHKTGNIFAEEKKIWPSGKVTGGWMQTENPDYLCVLDMTKQRLYILNFAGLKKIYKQRNRYVQTDLGDNISGGYLVPLYKCHDSGIMVYETDYYYNEDWDLYEIATA